MNRLLAVGIVGFLSVVIGVVMLGDTPASACGWGGWGGGCCGWGGVGGGCYGGGCYGGGCYGGYGWSGGGYGSYGSGGYGYGATEYSEGYDGTSDGREQPRVPPPPPSKDDEDGKKKAEAKPLGFRPVSFAR
jgi:hypothetical protein